MERNKRAENLITELILYRILISAEGNKSNTQMLDSNSAWFDPS